MKESLYLLTTFSAKTKWSIKCLDTSKNCRYDGWGQAIRKQKKKPWPHDGRKSFQVFITKWTDILPSFYYYDPKI